MDKELEEPKFVNDYIGSDGVICPYCGEDGQVVAGDPTAEVAAGFSILVEMTCLRCHNRWDGQYCLTSMIDTDLNLWT